MKWSEGNPGMASHLAPDSTALHPDGLRRCIYACVRRAFSGAAPQSRRSNSPPQVSAMIRNPLRAFAAVATLLFAAGAFAAPLPAFTAHYQLLKDGSPIGEATMTLSSSGDDTWTFVTDSKGTSGLAAML